jgi:KDO2-lipid IV(A) lauroyltransferase
MRGKRIHKSTMPRRSVPKPKRAPVAEFLHNLRYRAGEYGLRALVALLPRIPYRWLAAFTAAMARITFLLMWKYRRRMEESVTRALGQRLHDPAARCALVRRAWKNFARGILDTMAVMHKAQDEVIGFIGIRGEEHLQRALAKGKGVIALSAHLGAFTLIGPRLAAAGYSFSVVVKHPPDERFAKVMNDLRAQIGVRTISARPRQEAVKGILRALRANGVVLVIADEFKSGGVDTSFMGQRAAAPRGPASLALRTGAAIVPIFAPRDGHGSVTLEIAPELELARHSDIEESVAEATRIFSNCIEEAIFKYPDQWNWLGFPRPDRISRAEFYRRWRARRTAAAGRSQAAQSETGARPSAQEENQPKRAQRSQ